MGARRAVVVVVASILLAGCAQTTDVGARDPAPTSTPTPVTTEPTPTIEPDLGIPAGLVLPHETEGTVQPATDAGRLYDYICLDPADPSVLGTGFVEAREVVVGGGPDLIERLVAYPSTEQAERAVQGLRDQVALCGDGVDHVGQPMSWQVDETPDLPDADEALVLTYRSDGAVGAVVTVARTGRAVFYLDRRDQSATREQDRRAVAGFVGALTAALG
jgi:hypothetical protein